MTRVAVLPGDGIGPEVTCVAVDVLEAAGFQGSFMEHDVGWACWRRDGEPLPNATLQACRDADAILFGAITSRPDPDAQDALPPRLRGKVTYRSPILRLRQELDLWANVRPVHGNGFDAVVFRENTEGLYTDIGPPPMPGVDGAVDLRVITRHATQRICRAAFDHAARSGRTRVSLLEKANVLRRTGALVRDTFYEVAGEHPAIEADDLNIDAACALAVSDPARFDVVVTTNLFGDIFTDVAAAVAGGLPRAPSASIGDHGALFEPVHGSAPDIAGQGLADPRAAVASAAWLARHVGEVHVADRIERALAGIADHTNTARTRQELLDGLVVTLGP